MPSKSEKQRRLFSLAYAVKTGKKSRSEVSDEVLNIVDNMSKNKIKDFMVKEDGSLLSFLKEAFYYNTKYSNSKSIDFEPEKKLLVVIKPGFLKLIPEILQLLEDNNFTMDRIKTKTLTTEEAKRLYKPHSKADFFNSLVEYMVSGPCTAITLNFNGDIDKEIKKQIGRAHV